MADNRAYDEKAVLQQIAEGDEQAFARFYHHYYEILRPFIWKHSPSREDAEEIMQQTFVRTWLHRDELVTIENVKAWLFKVAAREYLTLTRNRLTRRLTWTSLETADVSSSVQWQEMTEPMSLQEVNELVNKAVGELSGQRKLIFQLRRRDLLTISEIADQLQLSPKTVKNTLTAAQLQVRKYLTGAGYCINLVALLSLYLL